MDSDHDSDSHKGVKEKKKKQKTSTCINKNKTTIPQVIIRHIIRRLITKPANDATASCSGTVHCLA